MKWQLAALITGVAGLLWLTPLDLRDDPEALTITQATVYSPAPTYRPTGLRPLERGSDDYELLTDPVINLWVGRQMWEHAARSGCPWRLWTTRGKGWCA
jgi:hypothetical protein